MPSVNLTDAEGSLKTSPDQAKEFLDFWFSDTDLIAITSKPKTKMRKTLTQWGTKQEWFDEVFSQDDSLVLLSDNGLYDTYFGVNPHKKELTPNKRGTIDNILRNAGTYVDIDIKDGAFESQDEIISFLDGLQYPPSAMVGSGSGGVHAYWKFDEDSTKSTIDQFIVERWWSYLQEQAGDRHIDKLTDLTRMMRLPGSVYLPKVGSNLDTSMVKLLSISGRTYSKSTLFNASLDSYEHIRESRVKTYNENTELDRKISEAAVARLSSAKFTGKSVTQMTSTEIKSAFTWKEKEPIGKFMTRIARICAEQTAIAEFTSSIQNKYDWSDILEPRGWTFLRDLPDGAREWARPGRQERSATTDWIDPDNPEFGSSGAMSLLSTSDETGLLDLKEAGVPLTKWRVVLRFVYGDDINKMLAEELPNA